MPKWLHDKLARQGRKKGLKGKRLKAYIYSVLNDRKLSLKKGKRKGRSRRLAKPSSA